MPQYTQHTRNSDALRCSQDKGHLDHGLRSHLTPPPPGLTAALQLLHCCRYTPDANGYFAGQSGYGYISIASFIEAAAAINSRTHSIAHYEREGVLALASSTLAVTAILQAGRLSLDHQGAAVDITYDDNGQPRDVVLASLSSR
jgi:hypothetical protein